MCGHKLGGREPARGFHGTVRVAGNEADLSDRFEEIHGKWNSCLCYFIKVVGIKSVSKLKKQIPIFEVLQQRIKRAAKAGCSFGLDVTDLMDRCQMGETLSEEEVQIISYYLDLTAGEEELGGESEKNWEFAQHTQLMVNFVSFKFVICLHLVIFATVIPTYKKIVLFCVFHSLHL